MHSCEGLALRVCQEGSTGPTTRTLDIATVAVVITDGFVSGVISVFTSLCFY